MNSNKEEVLSNIYYILERSYDSIHNLYTEINKDDADTNFHLLQD